MTIKIVKILKDARYSFDNLKNKWYCGKKPVDEEDVLIYLIKYAKLQNIKNAGEFAEATEYPGAERKIPEKLKQICNNEACNH